jgi:hypothetical protein
MASSGQLSDVSANKETKEQIDISECEVVDIISFHWSTCAFVVSESTTLTEGMMQNRQQWKLTRHSTTSEHYYSRFIPYLTIPIPIPLFQIKATN